MAIDVAERLGGLTNPLHWPWAMRSPPVTSSDATSWKGALLRCWSGTSSVMEQPPLDHHYVVMHLGGAKQVHRRHDGPAVSAIADSGSLTLVPAGTSYAWRTEGPIAFAHLYVSPQRLEDVIGHELNANPAGASLKERVGCRDPLLEPLLASMIGELQRASPSTLRLDSLHEGFVLRLARNHTATFSAKQPQAVALAPHRLRRALEFIDVHLGRDISLADLVAAVGSSQFHFSRAFRLATGCSPYRYLLRRRMDYAKVLLMTSDASIESIAAACGFGSRKQFSLTFKRLVGVGPKRYQLDRAVSRADVGEADTGATIDAWSSRRRLN